MFPAGFTLLTERLRLRAWAPTDTAALHTIWGDPEVIWWGASPDEAATDAVLARFVTRTDEVPAGLGLLAAELRESGAVVANFLLSPAPFTDGVELGFHVRRDHQGRGLASEGGRALLEHAFHTLGLPRVVAAVVPDNAPSRAVLARLGFVEIGRVEHGGLEHLLLERRAVDVSPEGA